MISGIGQIFIRARDLDAQIAFYRDVLGLRFLFQAPPKMAFFQCGATRLLLGAPEKAEFDHPSSIVYFSVDDIQAQHLAMASRGARFVAEPHVVHRAADYDLWLAEFKDADDNTHALMCEQPRKR
jgi:methylmalonyl-CoA/ethylmalonyl-CoA epimerase